MAVKLPHDAPVLLILGYGPNIGQAVAEKFSSHGYKVAIASRTLRDLEWNEKGWLELNINLADADNMPPLFEKVVKNIGVPHVVVYNAAIRNVLPAADILSAVTFPSVATLRSEFDTNMLSNLIAAQQAVVGFKQLPASATKTYIFTANALNERMLHFVPTFDMTKNAARYLIEAASVSYHDAGYSFYYSDERHEDGQPVLEGWDGPSRAELYWNLVTNKPAPFQQTYVKGKGYVDFRQRDFEERLERMKSFGSSIPNWKS